MQITSITDTNYIGNPGFLNDTLGWSVAGGNINRITNNGYTNSTCAQFTPVGNYGYIEYDVTSMSTPLSYVGQARVLAGAGQQIFISFADGSGYQSYIASGGWDLLTTTSVMQTSANFGLQIGIGYELLVNVAEHANTAESFNLTPVYVNLNVLSVQDSTSINEYYAINAGSTVFISENNYIQPQENVTTSENYSIKVGAQAPFVSGNLFFITVNEFSSSYENVFASIDIATDRTILVDAVMLEQSSSASPYFDGDSGPGYHWYGTEGDSVSYYRQFEAAQAALSSSPQWEVLISWTRALSTSYTFFTIGSSFIGGPDFIAGASTGFPTFFNQYQYGDYSDYLLSASVTRNIGQYPYGAFGSQLNMLLDNSSFVFLPGYDPTIGSYIISRRPIEFQVGFGGELINLFAGSSTKPANDIQNRTLSITAFDGMDFLNSFISTGAGPIALANHGNYVNLPAQVIIGDLLQEAGFTSTQYVLEQSLQSNIGYLCPSTYSSSGAAGAIGSVGSIIYDICEAEQGLFFFDESGVGHFWNREHIPTNTTTSWSFDYSDIVNFQTEDTPIINDVTVQAQPRVVQSLQNIWQLTQATIIPPATTSQVIQNIAINGNFVTATGGYYNSGFTVNSQENVSSAEFIIQYITPEVLRINVNDATQITEQPFSFISAANKLFMSEAVTVSEFISIKVGALAPYVKPLALSVSDSIVTAETLYMLGRDASQKEISAEFAKVSETVNVQIVTAARTLPYLTESVYTYESYNITTQTITGWGVNNATLYQSPIGPIVNNSGQITTQGGSTSYLFQQYNCSVSTQYVTQCQVKGFPSTTVTLAAVQNGVILGSTTVTLDGNWDTIAVPAFNTNPINTTFQIRIYSQSAATFNVAAVMTQLGVGSLTSYFDGASSTTPNYDFTWAGTPYISVSNANPVGSAVIVASFDDENGALPVTAIDAPTYNNNNLDSSFLTNLNQDGSGITGSQYVSLQGAVLNGSNYTMTFVNTYTQPIYITQCTLYGTPAKVVYSINQEYKNPTSIAQFGTNPTNNGQTLVISNNLIQDPSTALSNAYSLVNDYSNPYQRMTAEVFPAYHLQIGDNVNITINDTAQTQSYTIVGITNGVGTNGAPTQHLEVEVKNLVHYFTINQSAIGSTDSIAP